MRWFRRLSLRGRLILIGTAGLALGLAAGGVILVGVLHLVLQRNLDTGARQTAADVAALVQEGRLPDPIPTAGTHVVQVLDANFRIRAASIGADRLVALLRPAELERARAGEVIPIDGAQFGLSGPLRVAAASAGTAAEPRTVVAAVPARDVEASVSTLRGALLIAYPLLVATLAVLAWRVVAWTLRPVEALRAGAEEITGASLMGRLPVPDGRDEVHRLAVTLNGMLDRLGAARERQRRFVGDAAHELRSPLASLYTQLEVAERLGERLPAADLLPDIDRLRRLIDDLLLLARADEGGDPRLRRAEEVDLTALLREVAAAHPHAHVAVTVHNEQPLWTVTDPDAVHRIVENLVSNAVRHAHSRVELAAAATPDGVELTVSDDGPGIPEADRQRVFGRFTRLDDARTRDGSVEGAGLGLAIVRELVRLLGGTVTLEDANPGVRARIRWPDAAATEPSPPVPR